MCVSVYKLYFRNFTLHSFIKHLLIPTVSTAMTRTLRILRLLGHRTLVSRALVVLLERNLQQYIVLNIVLAASTAHRELWKDVGEKLTLNQYRRN